ncbi:MAG: BlaI/MecI/CopY family transcriptional regulator [Planctomyces sp.]
MRSCSIDMRREVVVLTEYRLTRCELQLMNVLWDIHEGSVQDVCDRLERTLAYTTVMTTLNLLAVKKKVLAREKRGRAFIYRPLVTRDEVSRNVLSDLKSVLFGSRLPSLVLNLLAESEHSTRDAAILKEAIEKLEQKD